MISFYQISPGKTLMHFLCLQYVPHAPPISIIRSISPEYLVKSARNEALRSAVFSNRTYLVHPRLIVFPCTLSTKHLSLCTSPSICGTNHLSSLSPPPPNNQNVTEFHSHMAVIRSTVAYAEYALKPVMAAAECLPFLG
jgi:hypothetical protein